MTKRYWFGEEVEVLSQRDRQGFVRVRRADGFEQELEERALFTSQEDDAKRNDALSRMVEEYTLLRPHLKTPSYRRFQKLTIAHEIRSFLMSKYVPERVIDAVIALRTKGVT